MGMFLSPLLFVIEWINEAYFIIIARNLTLANINTSVKLLIADINTSVKLLIAHINTSTKLF